MDLVIGKQITDTDKKKLKKSIGEEELEIASSETKMLDEGATELVKVIFRNFDAISFLRDGVLWALVDKSFSEARKFVKSKFGKNKEVTGSAMIGFKQDEDSTTTLNIGFSRELDDEFLKKLENKITEEFINEVESGATLYISWDKENRDIKVQKL